MHQGKRAAFLIFMPLLLLWLIGCPQPSSPSSSAAYTVAYDGNGSTGGSVPTDGTAYKQGNSVIVAGNSGTLVKTGYNFAGWNTKADGSGTTYSIGATLIMGTANVTLYARWLSSSSTFTVTYSANSGAAITGSLPVDSKSPYPSGATVTVLSVGSLKNPGYALAGWMTTNSDGSWASSYASGATFAIGTSNVTLYAIWIPSDLSFMSSGSSIAITGNIGAPSGTLAIPSGVTTIGPYAFNGCSGLTSVTIPSSATSIGNSAFYGCSSLTSVTIPSSVISIGDGAFVECSQLKTISIPASVSSIGTEVFLGCSSLVEIDVDPANQNYKSDHGVLLLNVLKAEVLQAPMALASYTIPNDVNAIGPAAFYDCSIQAVTLPSGITFIGNQAFFYCSNLKSVTINATSPPELAPDANTQSTDPSKDLGEVFAECSPNLKIYVPTASVSQYQNANYWKFYASMIVSQ